MKKCEKVDPLGMFACSYSYDHDGDHSWESGDQKVSIILCEESSPGKIWKCGYRASHAGDHSWYSGDFERSYHIPSFNAAAPEGIEDMMKALLADIFDGESTDEDMAQFRIMIRALEKFHERDAKHRGLWRYFGAMDSAFQLRAKGTRTYNTAIQMLKEPKNALGLGLADLADACDDPLDAINYAVFFIRNVEEGRFG